MCKVCLGKEVVTGVNDLATTHPYVLKYWDYKKNNEKGVYPTKITYGSQTDVNWICEQGHSTHSSVAKKIAQNCSCSECNSAKGTSYPEQYLFYCFSKIFKEVYNRYDLYGKEADIYIKDLNIAIEYNGYQFHKTIDRTSSDKKKKELWKSKGVNYIERFTRNRQFRRNICPTDLTHNLFPNLHPIPSAYSPYILYIPTIIPWRAPRSTYSTLFPIFFISAPNHPPTHP